MMKQHTVYTYGFDELNKAAQEKAWLENYYKLTGDYSDDFEAVLRRFEHIFDIKVYNWSVDEYTYKFDFVKGGAATDCPEGDPLRVARYMWNNYADAITKGKYYSKGHYYGGKYSYKFRHSAVLVQMDNCPLTGFFADTDILRPVINCLHYKEFFEDIDDLLTACLNSFFETWQSAVEYSASLEYFEETAIINEWEFLDNGTLWRGL